MPFLPLRPPTKRICRRFNSQDGIAIGPILFVIAVLGLLAAVMSSNMGTMSTAGVTDRIGADIPTQGDLIRAKILECNAKYGTDRNLDGYPSSGGASVDVSTLTCVGDEVGLGSSGNVNIWTGPRPTTLPSPTQGFTDWQYINTNSSGLGGTATGGRCIYTQPCVAGTAPCTSTVANPNTNPGLVQGLAKAAGKFTMQTTCNGTSTPCVGDGIYNSASASQKFIMWVTLPPTGSAPNAACLP